MEESDTELITADGDAELKSGKPQSSAQLPSPTRMSDIGLIPFYFHVFVGTARNAMGWAVHHSPVYFLARAVLSLALPASR